MKTKSQTKLLIFTTILMFFIVAAYGVIDSWQDSKSITEGYKTSITLKETVVFDDQLIVKQYGGPVTLEAGTAGEIYEIIAWFTEEHEYKHIRAEFTFDEDKKIGVILDYEAASENDSDVIIDTYNGTINPLDDKSEQYTFVTVTPTININKINDSQKIASEFKQMRERYYQRVKQTIRDGSIKGAIVALALVVVIWLVKLIVRKEKVGKVLVILTICIDGLMLHVDALAFYLTLAMA